MSVPALLPQAAGQATSLSEVPSLPLLVSKSTLLNTKLFAAFSSGTAVNHLSTANLAAQKYLIATATNASATTTTVGAVGGAFNVFVDSSNAVWIGYANYDIATTIANYVYQAYVAQLDSNMFSTSSSSSRLLCYITT